MGDSVHLRGIINFSNWCVRRCTYCGINADNRGLRRYLMTSNEIVECTRTFRQWGLMTAVLQSGEDRRITTGWVTGLIDRIRREDGLAVTLSLGERQEEELATWRAAGAERYLLKIESSNRELYESMQPGRRNTWLSRMEVLKTLQALDYEVGTGIMVGIPGQTLEMLADDLLFIGDLEPDMIGIGPYIPHPATSLPAVPRDRIDQVPNDQVTTLKTLALMRMICPEANIPATTALLTISQHRELVSCHVANVGTESDAVPDRQGVATRHSGGYGEEAQRSRSGYGAARMPRLLRDRALKMGLACGANVIMPDRTPAEYRRLYDIYPSRIPFTTERLTELQNAIGRMGRTISSDSGRSVSYLKRGRIEPAALAGSER